MKTTLAAFEQAIRSHDKLLQRRDLAIWVGAEPTFTDRRSEAPEWLTSALGPRKQRHACRMLAECLKQAPGSAVLRTLGRQYPQEDRPRWSLGLYQRRDGRPVWSGPPDPLLESEPLPLPEGALEEFWERLAQQLGARGWTALVFPVESYPNLRIAFRCDSLPLLANPEREPRLARPSPHGRPIPTRGLHDDLAEEGTFLLGIGWPGPEQDLGEVAAPCVELPACGETTLFLTLLEAVGEAANAARLPGLILTGFPPAADATVAWTTLTPDPAVVEINTAPMPDATAFLKMARTGFAAAEAAGLSPCRLHYNGQVSDSGGGGQLTLGGPTPDASPFLTYPRLLPALIGYFNRHPALSYYFAGDFVGNSSQAPRADERTSDVVEELALALTLLDRQRNPGSELLWQSLSPFLTDPTGNPHRSEINIEKLWNPTLLGRGQLGLVEFRAFRMPPTPERLAALAVLLRAIAARLIVKPEPPEFQHWGRELHDRFALPFYLRADLWEVLDDLASAGLGLGQPLIAELLDDSYYQLGEVECGDCRISIRRALEFWPLLGDAIAREHGHSRLVDASTARLEISLCARARTEPVALANWRLTANGYRLPLRREDELDGETWLRGLRYRRFKPWTGLHPTLAAQGPLELTLRHPREPEALRITLYEWKPQGGGYEGLPADPVDAAIRRAERFVVERLATAHIPPPLEPPAHALTPYCFDLRWL